jgi:signal transduction histidine kinase
LPAAAAWEAVRHDPGAVLLAVRHAPDTHTSPSFPLFPAALHEPAILEGALRFLAVHGEREFQDGPAPAGPASLITGFVDWNQPSVRPIYLASWHYAQLARRIAECTGRCDPENAWVAGLLAPLGWLAVCAVAPERAAACLADAELLRNPSTTQARHWGLDQAGIARRLARRWRLPAWLAGIIGSLSLPGEIACSLGVEPDLFRVVQLAVWLVQQCGAGLHLAVGSEPADNFTALGITAAEQAQVTTETAALAAQAPPAAEWNSPYHVPLLRDLLGLAARNLRLRDVLSVERLEQERDQLHQALEQRRKEEAERLRALKLNALAEFAAGAAHEINNPLAVISGQAQHLLSRETDADRRQALQTIIGQTQRVHRVLRELMQFARPPRPQRQHVDLGAVIHAAAGALADLAVRRQVRLEFTDPDPPLHLDADPRLIQTALECLVRNAIEAAPLGGWAGIRLARPTPENVELVIEDNGDGPAPAERDHLFDPFYSGRQAGRGRGLGLPTAWRLAQEHGGDVRFERPEDGPTRFVLCLPCRASLLSSEHANGKAENGHSAVNGNAFASHPDATAAASSRAVR